MPQIKEYQSSAQAVGATGGGRARFGMLDPIVQGFGELGRSVADVGKAIQERQEQNEEATVRSRTAQVHAAQTRALEEQATAAAPGDMEFERRFMEQLDSAYDEIENGMELRSPRSRSLLTALRDKSVQALGQRAFWAQAALTGKKAKLDKEAELAERENTVSTDPSQFETQRRLMQESIANDVRMPGEAKAEFSRMADERLAFRTLSRVVDNDPDEGFRQLESGSWNKLLSGEGKAQLLAEAMRKRTERDAMSRGETQWRLEATLASIEATGVDPGLLTEHGVRKTFAKEPATAERLLSSISRAKSFYALQQRHALTTPEEDMAALAKLRETIPGPNAAQTAHQADEFRRALDAKYEAIQDDAYGYLLKAAPNLAAEATAAGEAGPAQFTAFLAKVDQMQAGMGVPEWKRGYLGKVAAARHVTEIHNGSPEDAANRLAAMQARYKAKWPNVVRELREARLDGTYLTLARLTKESDAVARADLAGALQAGIKTLRTNIGDAAAKTVADEVFEETADFAQTMQFNDPQIVADERASAEALAYLYVQRGARPKEAARTAARALLNDRYDYMGTFRAPARKGAQVAAAAAETLGGLKLDQFPPNPAADPALPEEYRRKQLWDYARRGVWVNTATEEGDEAGVQLFYPNGVPVLLQNGKRVVVKFKDAAPVKPGAYQPTPFIP